MPEDVDVKTANNYLNRVWSKEKIDANLPAFVDKVGSWLQEQDRILYNEADKARQAINDAQGEAKAALEKEYKGLLQEFTTFIIEITCFGIIFIVSLHIYGPKVKKKHIEFLLPI